MAVKVDKYSKYLEKHLAAGKSFEEAHTKASDEAAMHVVKNIIDKKNKDISVYKAKSGVPKGDNIVTAPKDKNGKVDLDAMEKKLISGGMDPEEVALMKKHILNRRKLDKNGGA